MYKDTDNFQIVKKVLLKSFPCQNALKCKQEGDILIVSNLDYTIHFLNETAKDFYLLCDGKRKLEEILQLLCKQYNVEQAVLEDDIVELITSMQKKRIIYVDPLEVEV